ncbi:NAD-dependent epimerase/dehydratase family protein [Methylocella silvestris]|uniref:NAD-dependent epimerase/dehydratase domain-containing protein n=1 Tax=Methylocella silvestris TaxID=199596 RepID=A0A2J7TE29_METSI|nr:NAD-dependent epimerase/dehydratase family protein [Methylocella silvestris]PNG25025.1 hypothetical protein CR492_15350 [Methylocella silvestris]
MTVLITGATGFVGQALLKELAQRDEEVIVVSGKPRIARSSPSMIWRTLPNYEAIDWLPLLDGVSTIYHLAWSSLPQSSNSDPVGDALDNIVGSLRLIEAANKKGGVRFVFTSSGGTVYGPLSTLPAPEIHRTRPTCAYGVSKLTVEKYLDFYHDLYGFNAVSLRISNPYGPGQSTGRNFGAIATFASLVLDDKPINIYGDGSVVRDYLYISDLVRAIVAAGSVQSQSRVINVGSGAGHSLNDVIDVIRSLTGRSIKVNYLPPRRFDVPISVLDVSRAEVELGWTPIVSFADGIEATLQALSGWSDKRA